MNKSFLWKALIASSLLLASCNWKEAPKTEEQDDIEDDIEFVETETRGQITSAIRYPAKYKDRDRFDENGNNISLKQKEYEKADSLLSDSTVIDSVAVDSLLQEESLNSDSLQNETRDSLKIDSILSRGQFLHDRFKALREDTANAVYITIDDGPWAYTQEIADELHKRWHKATFFLIWNNIKEKFYPVMQQAALQWHEFWNHSNTHANFRKISEEKAESEIETTRDKIEAAWVHPAPYFRFPYWNKASNDKMFKNYLKENGYGDPVFRNIDTRDWNKRTTKESLIRCLEKVKPGDVILIHERSYTVDKTIPPLDSILKSKGLHSIPYRKK